MRNLSITAAVLLLLVLATGCTERTEPTASTDALATAFFDFASRPDVAGIVLRGEGEMAGVAAFGNIEDGLISVHSTSYPPLPFGAESCSPATDFDYIYWQDVASPSGKWHELWIAPKAFVAVYDWPDTWPDCDYWNNVTGKLLAEGQVQWMYVDNDLTGGAGWGGTGANTYQIKASGNIKNVTSGRSHGYQMMRMWQILPDGTSKRRGTGPTLNPDPR